MDMLVITLGEVGRSDVMLASIEDFIERVNWYPGLPREERVSTALVYLAGMGIGMIEKLGPRSDLRAVPWCPACHRLRFGTACIECGGKLVLQEFIHRRAYEELLRKLGER